MIARVDQLIPGDLVSLGGQSAVFIASGRHPLHPRLALVVWKLDDGTWSLDALSHVAEVGELVPSANAERWQRITAAFGR